IYQDRLLPQDEITLLSAINNTNNCSYFVILRRREAIFIVSCGAKFKIDFHLRGNDTYDVLFSQNMILPWLLS
ncbi:TPA: hypothetical protein ACQDP3_002056, partial [Legionella pneumophila]